jgi:hypothetical protein
MKPTAPRKRRISDSVRSALFATAMAAGMDEVAAAGSIGGTVYGPGGSPVAGADVTLQRLGGIPSTAVTDALGKYNFQDPSTGCYSIKASSPSFGSYYYVDGVSSTIVEKDRGILDHLSTVEVASADIHAEFGSRSMSGVVRILTANPSGEARVGLTTAEGFRTSVEITVTEGSPGEYPFILVNVPQGDWVVVARRPSQFNPWYDGDTASLGLATVTHVGASNVTGIEINLPAAPEVVATVQDGNGVPQQNHAVGVYEIPFLTPSAFNYTDQNGQVRLPLPNLLPGAQVLVNSYGTSFQPAFGNPAGSLDWFTDPRVLSGGDNLVTLTVPQDQGAVTGHISEAGSATTISFGRATLESAVENTRPQGWPWQRNADFSGNYAINAGVPPGWYQVTASGPATAGDFHVPRKSPAALVGNGALTWDAVLEVGGRAQVTVQGPGGPVSLARVRLFNASCEWVDTNLTGFGGVYVSPNVPPGTYVVCAEGSGFAAGCSGGAVSCAGATPFAIPASTVTSASLDLVPRTERRVSGTLRDSQGNPVPFMEIGITASLFLPGGRIFTDACGDFSFSGEPGQSYALGVYEPEKGSALLIGAIGNSDQVLDLTLQSWTTAVRGFVTDDQSHPLQGVRVCADSERHCVETDSRGSYRLGARPGALDLWLTGQQEYGPKLFPGLQVGATPLVHDVSLEDVPIDAYEVNDLTNSLSLTFGVRYDRSFKSAEDVDWQKFPAVAGKYYKADLGGPIIRDRVRPSVALFDELTKNIDRRGAQELLQGTWSPKVSGTYHLGASSSIAAGYTIELTESDSPVVPTPTVGSISPTSGPAGGGTAVTIKGTDFQPNSTVWFGAQWATNVTFVDSTTITCWTPSLGAGALYDLTVDNPGGSPVTAGPRRPAVSGTLAKAWFADFGDVPQSYLFHGAIEAVFRAGITTGCGGGNYCPGDPVTRDAMAVFILRGKNGGAFLPPAATGNVLQDVTATTFLARWMEQFFNDGITTGCGTSPGASKPNYCPTGNVTRDGMSVFLLRGKNGSAFLPPAATGTVFADVSATTFLARWMEGLEAANITQGCGGGNYCPLGLVSRGEMASFIRRTFGL